jgi:hypothetical protein
MSLVRMSELFFNARDLDKAFDKIKFEDYDYIEEVKSE